MNRNGPLMVLTAMLLLGATLIANAQAQYLAPPYYQVPITPTPPSWSYDPYTSGLSPCPQWRHGDPRCSDQMPPTYGQPGYRQPGPIGAY